MTDDDFESRLRALLNEHVDAQVGPRADAPDFDRARVADRPRTRAPWIFPLAAAACVVLAAAGTVTATQLLSQNHHVQPGVTDTPTAPTPAVPTGTRDVTPTTSPTTGSHGRPASTHPASASAGVRRSTSSAAPRQVALGGASVALPAGWVARPLQKYFSGGSSPIFPGWCLTPASTPISVEVDACPVTLTQVQVGGNPLDVDTIGGLASNPHPCGQAASTADESYADRTLGGRAADWRRWTVHCTTTGRTARYEQYVVPTVPGWILYSGHATDAIDAAMTRIAAGSALPAETGKVRLMDRGYLRSVARTATGVRISLDRVVSEGGGFVNRSPRTYTYVVPTAVFGNSRREALKVGSLVYLNSDGTRVTDIYPD